MATRRSTRVTQVNPWIPGGEGQLRDLFPLPPLLFLFIRGIGVAARHAQTTLLILLSLYLWWIKDWGWFPAFVLLPLLIIILKYLTVVFYLWFKNPAIPLLSRKSNSRD